MWGVYPVSESEVLQGGSYHSQTAVLITTACCSRHRPNEVRSRSWKLKPESSWGSLLNAAAVLHFPPRPHTRK